jgi:hypothetical protein
MAEGATLTIAIFNSRAIELVNLTESLQSLGRQYSRYLHKNKVVLASESKLHIQEVRSGGIIFELVDLAPLGLFDKVEGINTLIAFSKHLVEMYKWFTGPVRKERPKEDLKEVDLRNYANILGPVARDARASMTISSSFPSALVTSYSLTSSQAGEALSQIWAEIAEIRKVHPAGEYEQVVFYWDILKNQRDSGASERGIINSINQRPVRVVFASDEVKAQIAFMQDRNPMLVGFVVDVRVETIQEKPILYNILRVHGEL